MKRIDIHNGPRMRYVALAALVAIPLMLLTTACEDGPECLDYDTQVVPYTSTTIVNGRPVAHSGTHVVTVCVRYADPSPTASK